MPIEASVDLRNKAIFALLCLTGIGVSALVSLRFKHLNFAFGMTGQPAYGSHSFKHMLARHAVDTSEFVTEIVAVAQNLGHSGVLVTLQSYGQISRERQRQLVTGET